MVGGWSDGERGDVGGGVMVGGWSDGGRVE